MTITAGFRGADTAALDQLSTTLGDSSGTVQSLAVRLKAQWTSVEWFGTDADNFRTTILSLLGNMGATATAMATASSAVQKQSEQQTTTSSIAGGAPGMCVAPPALPGPSTTPAAATAWWKALTPAQQQAAIQANPRAIGAMNGVPVVARDQANRIVLGQQMAALQQQKAGLAEQYKYSNVDQRVRLIGRMTAVDDKIAGLTAIQTRLDAPGSDAYLLGVDTSGTGRVIMALGNPDTADHVGIFVPGMTSNISGAEGLINQAGVIRSAANAANPGDTNSSILWLGYDAPPGVVQAVFDSRAVKGGAALDDFVDGINATHAGGDADITVVGHSYGSLVTGIGDRDNHLDVDKIFFIGSPGVGVDNAAQLSVGAQNVYGSTAPNDIIRRTPSLGEAGRIGLSVLFPQMAPVLLPEALNPNNDAVRFGTSPASPSFGGTVVPTVRHNGSETEAHSSYFSVDNPAMISIGQVITGTPR